MATDLGVKVTTEGKYYFISYNTEDADTVSRYLKSMVDKGLPVWYDYGILVGDEWEATIAEKICGCEAVIMFLSNNVFKKEKSFVKKEWNIAKMCNKKIYLVILDYIDESNIPPRSAFWWNDIKDTQSIQAYTMEIDSCVDNILQSVGHKKKTADTPLLSLINDDFEIESGVLKKYKGKGGIVKIPYGVTSIGESAFEGCISFASVVIPDSVTTIGERAFSDCRLLTEIVIPDSVTTIGSWAFCGCTSLTSVVIPNSVTTIGNDAFCYCFSLTEIVIPDSVTSIGDNAFLNCISLTQVTIPESVESISTDAFDGCEKLSTIIYCGSERQWNEIEAYNACIPCDCEIVFMK